MFSFSWITKGPVLLSSNLADHEFSISFLCIHTLSSMSNVSTCIFELKYSFCFLWDSWVFCFASWWEKGNLSTSSKALCKILSCKSISVSSLGSTCSIASIKRVACFLYTSWNEVNSVVACLFVLYANNIAGIFRSQLSSSFYFS